MKCFLRYILSLTDNLENIRVTRPTELYLSSLFTYYLPCNKIHFMWRQKSFFTDDRIFFGIRKALPESELEVRRGGATCHLNHSLSSADSGRDISWSWVGYQLIAGWVSADLGWGISWSRVGYQLISGGVSADHGWGISWSRVGHQLIAGKKSAVRKSMGGVSCSGVGDINCWRVGFQRFGRSLSTVGSAGLLSVREWGTSKSEWCNHRLFGCGVSAIPKQCSGSAVRALGISYSETVQWISCSGVWYQLFRNSAVDQLFGGWVSAMSERVDHWSGRLVTLSLMSQLNETSNEIHSHINVEVRS